ncbi:MAG: TonB-dependent receptor, partial [Bacteroidota bacterium]
MKTCLLLTSVFLSAQLCIAQLGVIKGTVIDQQSEIPLIGATVELLTVDPITGATTDLDGDFVLTEVPTGRQIIRVSYLGYESLTLPNIDVSAGKDVVLELQLQESLNQIDEVVITAKAIKDQAQNEMASISARQFSLEEVNRYSGGRNDIARLAANFAGVATPDDSRNDIVIRGNSPTGVLWRLEGIPIPSPNHFSTLGTTGAPVSAVNPNILRNSDFITSAFPAEYGNALAGVFDLGFRNGNKDRTEYTFQVSAFSGFEGMIEGPLNKRGGSYLVAGRYSFVGIVGAGSTAAVPNYQDVSFKVDLGQTDIGRFTLFGIGGVSSIDFLGDEIDETDLFAAEDEDAFYTGQFGVVGLKHNLLLNDRTYLRTVVGASLRGNDFQQDRYFNFDQPDEVKLRVVDADNREERFTVSSYLNTKMSAKQTIRAGLLYEQFGTDAFLDDRQDAPDLNGDGEPDWFTVYDFDGSFGILQPYVQTKYRLSERLTILAGLHGQYSTLNEQFALEPRGSLSYALDDRNKLTLGYGIHNQNAPLPILFLNEDQGGELVRTNEDLDFVRAQHIVLGYDLKLANDWRLKTEFYHQELDRVPVESTATSYSTLTEGADFVFSDDKTSLVNEGTGFNRGVEITLEKFYSNGFHML